MHFVDSTSAHGRSLRLISIISLSLLLSSCAALRGGPASTMTESDIKTLYKPYFTDDPIKRFYSATPGDRGDLTPLAWRNAVMNARLELIESRYKEFRDDLSSQTKGLNLGLDLAVIGLSGGGAIASGATANALSAASAGLVGTTAALSKDVYYEKTLPAVLAVMDANHKEVLVRIFAGMQDTAEAYPLDRGLADLRALEQSSTMEGAISQLTTVAAKASADADKKLALYDITLVDDATQARRKAFTQYIWGLFNATNKAALDQIAGLMSVPVTADLAAERKAILQAFGQRALDKASMDVLSAALKPATNQDF